jgi:hypothetical protein
MANWINRFKRLFFRQRTTESQRMQQFWTPLVFAINAGYVRMVKLLIQAGADVHYQVPARQNTRGDLVPARRLVDFDRGKRAQSIARLLRGEG